MEISNVLTAKIRDYFKDKPVLRAYIFGSYSGTDADKNSDIDILVEYENLA